MRLPSSTLALSATLALLNCGPPPEPAVAAAQEFLAAVGRFDCAAVWTYFSTDAQAYVEAKSAELIAQTPYRDENLMPQNLYCRQFLMYQRDTAVLKSQSVSTAIVAVERYEADPKSFLIPGFWATRYNMFPEEIRMVQEAGTWKVVVP
jgi:hypothetical protein